jgi:aromatic ring-opening dioxygenase catalytic subunit (LigB family)
MRQPTFFLSHGGGPWPFMDGDYRRAHAQLEASLQALPATLPARPKAILMVSAHWEEAAFTVMTSPAPGMLYDYGGFPPHTYEVVYPAPGDPALAERVVALIQAGGLPAARDERRGFDHGAFCTLVPMFPKADVPVVQLSLKLGLDPAEHLALGRAAASASTTCGSTTTAAASPRPPSTPGCRPPCRPRRVATTACRPGPRRPRPAWPIRAPSTCCR